MKSQDKELKDPFLSQNLDKSDQSGLSSNFTHQVMSQLEGKKPAPKVTPLFSWWAWLIVGGTFATALVLTFTQIPLPDLSELTEVKSTKLSFYVKEIIPYLGLTFVLLAIIYAEQLLKKTSKRKNN